MLRRSLLWIFVGSLTLVLSLILAFNLLRGPEVSVTLLEPAPQDVLAPDSLAFISQILTEQARQLAAASVPDQYTQPDLSIARAQNNYARAVFGFMDVVRGDSSADQDTKTRYLMSIEGISVDENLAGDLLILGVSEQLAARDNVLQVIEDTMRQGVIEDQIDDARRKASQGAAFDLTPAQERVVQSLAPQFVVPNIFLDEAATAELQQERMNAVEPISQVVSKDQRILREGDIVREVDLEMLERFGLLQLQLDWQRAVSVLLASLISVIILTLYWSQYLGHKPNSARSLVIIGVLMVMFILSARLLMPGRTIYSYLYPAAALSIILAVIFDVRFAIIATVIQAGLVGFMSQESLEMTIYSLAGGTIAILTLRDSQRINALFRAGLVAAVGNVAVILMFRLPTNIEPAELMTLLLLGLINGPIISAGLSLAGVFLIGSVFRMVTPLQLQELSRLDHPLLQELLRQAPGTYHHSIMVANLAEQAAERIKVNGSLVRVGAFYHDVGKMNRAHFFTENQSGGNPHDGLDPYSSARIIISHVTDGMELARRYKLPNRIRDFITQHHGDRVLKTFYQKAIDAQTEGESVDISRFQYRGPRPNTPEAGLVQLADSIEAASSALLPNTEEEIERLVKSIVDDHLQEGQLDNSDFTLGDISLIRTSFIDTLKGRFHMRVKYPGNEALISGKDESDDGDDQRHADSADPGVDEVSSVQDQDLNDET
jgi:putative nucleotidyltransferase with HDIG domain